MPQPSYPFANIRIKVREKSLLSREKILRLAGAATAQEAMGLLADYGYPGAEDTKPSSFEKCISAELRNVYSFIWEITPEPEVTNLFFLQLDYHNLKAILKSDALGVGAAQNMLVNNGTIDPTAMFEAVKEKRYDFFPPEMKAALTEIDRRFAVKVDVSLIGLLLDGAYARQIERELKDVKEEFVHRYFRALFDFINVSALIRLKRLDAGKELMERTLLPGGDLSFDYLREAYELSMEEMLNLLEKSAYQKEMTPGLEHFRQTGSFAVLIKARNDYLIRLCLTYRKDMFSIAPVLCYLVGKMRETQAVRMAMLAKLNNISGREIAEILPETIE